MTVFSIYGKKPILEALSVNRRLYRFKELRLAHGRERDGDVNSIIRLASSKGIPTRFVEIRELDRWAPGYLGHQGLVLMLNEPPVADEWDDVLTECRKRRSALLVALDSVSDHQNVGAIARCAAAFGAMGLVAPRDRAAPLIHPAVWRVAQGAAEHIRLVSVVNLSRALAHLKEEGFWIVGASMEAKDEDLAMVREWPAKICLVFGGEASGLRRLTLESCDIRATIRQKRPGGLDSLNLAGAAAIFLWEIAKRKGPHGSMDRVLPSEGKDGGSIPPGDKF